MSTRNSSDSQMGWLLALLCFIWLMSADRENRELKKRVLMLEAKASTAEQINGPTVQVHQDQQSDQSP